MKFLQQYGHRLLDRSYPIVPIKLGHKYPRGLDNWEHTQADAPQLNKWLSNGFADGGVGILTKYYPAVDLDVLDVEITEKLVDWCKENIGNTLSRTGQAPKTLLVYRTEQPFSKYTSTHYEDYLGERHRIEVLGEGQQFVAYATHPGTGEAYTWQDGKGLADVDPNSLPVITPDQITALFAYFDELAEASDWEVVKRSRDGANRKTYTNAAEVVLAHSKPPLDISREKIKKTLAAVSSDDYTDWVMVGMGLFHQFDGSDEGLMLWDEWSSGSDKYAAGVCEAKWPSFDVVLKQHTPTTFASTLALANEKNGACTDGGDNTDHKDPLNQFVDRYVYIENGDLVADLDKSPHHSINKLGEFRNATANVRHEIDVPAPTEKDPNRTKKKVQAVNLSWLVHPDRQSAQGTRYIPQGERVITDDGLPWINTYYVPEFGEAREQQYIKLFLDHMTYLVPDDIDRAWLIGWVARIIQHPEHRCHVVPLHISQEHGTGRGWLLRLIEALIGKHNVSRTSMYEFIESPFNEFLSECLVCAIEEVKEGGNQYELSDRIKDKVEAPRLTINRKYGAKQMEPIFASVIMFSNHLDALVLPPEDRRVYVIDGPVYKLDKDYYSRLYKALEADRFVASVYWYLRELDISSYNFMQPRHNEARQALIDGVQSDTEQLFWLVFRDPPYRVMQMNAFLDAMRLRADEVDMDAFDLNDKQARALFKKHAGRKRQVRLESGQVKSVFILDRGLTDIGLIKKEATKAIKGELQK